MQRHFDTLLFSVLLPIYGKREAGYIQSLMLPELNDFTDKQLAKVIVRLKTSEPWQYVLGKEWFYDLEFKVTAATLIPRPETEELVFQILNNHKENSLQLLDIGTGSGCIPISIQSERPEWEVSACDISEEALKVAQENNVTHETNVQFFQEDILNPTENSKKWDIIVSNPPYIPMQEMEIMQKNVLDFEPHQALFVTNEDPLVFYRKIGEFALTHLKSSGHLYFELNEFYAEKTQELIQGLGFKNVEITQDLSEKNRMLKASI